MNKRSPQAGTQVQVRLQPADLDDLDGWIERQQASFSRAEGIRRILHLWIYERTAPTADWPQELVEALDTWIAQQPKPMSRPDAIRAFVAAGLHLMKDDG